MKWSELYTHLLFEDKIDPYTVFYLGERVTMFIISGDTLEYHGEQNGGRIQVKIMEIKKLQGQDVVLIRFDTSGVELPLGFKHGVYDIQMDAHDYGSLQGSIPQDMLEDGTVPKSIMRDWSQIESSDKYPDSKE